MSHSSMGLLAWLVLGAVAGWFANRVTGPGRRLGLLANLILGIAGAYLGGFIFRAAGGAGITGLNLYSLLVAVLGAALLLTLVRAVSR